MQYCRFVSFVRVVQSVQWYGGQKGTKKASNLSRSLSYTPQPPAHLFVVFGFYVFHGFVIWTLLFFVFSFSCIFWHFQMPKFRPVMFFSSSCHCVARCGTPNQGCFTSFSRTPFWFGFCHCNTDFIILLTCHTSPPSLKTRWSAFKTCTSSFLDWNWHWRNESVRHTASAMQDLRRQMNNIRKP